MDESEEAIDDAIQSLQKGIDQLLHRATAKKPHLDTENAKKRVHRLVRHIRHLLIQLLRKRRSLQALIEWLSNEWKSRLQCKLTDPLHTQEILAHALQCLVRCQDGFMLLTSGECRHPVDIEEAQRTKFPSRLTTLQERADGYTKLYSGTAYSGFGWDEYANETVGIQARLVQALRPYHKDPWRYLENFTQLLDILLDRQEEVVKNLKQALQAIKLLMTADITKQLAKPIVFSTQDKMEKLQVLVPATGTKKEQKISVARLANNFQIHGQSVLPNEFQTIESWRQQLALDLGEPSPAKTTATNKKRRRLAIDEDSDTSDSKAVAKSKKTCGMHSTRETGTTDTKRAHSTGLEIRVETSQKVTETEHSLSVIKAQMGVNAKDLEISWQDLEHESTLSIRHDSISMEEANVRRLQNILQRAEQRRLVDRDENEIWDARECLRQAYMELGNRALWFGMPHRNLEKALASFQQAKKLVIQQQNFHQQIMEKTNDQTDDSRIISRNLIFLLAQAVTNTGITIVEMAQSQQGGAKNKRLYDAIRELRCARDLLATLRVEAISDLSKYVAHSTNWINLKGEILEADKLESMTCRWLGSALWTSEPINCVSSTEKIFEEGWSLFRGFDVAYRNQLFPQLLDLAIEAIYTTATVAEIGCSKLECIDRQSSRDDGETCLTIVTCALAKQVEILRALETLKNADDSYIKNILSSYEEEHNFRSSHDIEKICERIRRWWTDVPKQPSRVSHQTSQCPFGRTDLFTSGDKRPLLFRVGVVEPTTAPSTRSIMFAPESLSRQIYRNLPNSTENEHPLHTDTTRTSQSYHEIVHRPFGKKDGVDLLSHSGNNQLRYKRPSCFRKWGDQILFLAAGDPPCSFLSASGISHTMNIAAIVAHSGDDERAPELIRADPNFSYPTVAPSIPLEMRRIFETQK